MRNLFALSVLAAIGQGCFTVGVIESDGGLPFTTEHALRVARVIRHSSYQGGAFGGPKASEVTAAGIRLVAGGTVIAGATPWGPRYEKRPVREVAFIQWGQIRRVRIRYHTLLNTLCVALLFHLFPSFFIMDLEDASGRVLFRIFPWGQLWRNICPVWLFTSSYGYCRHIARAILYLSRTSSSGGMEDPGGPGGYR
jgi:hypothetical protein